MCPRVCLCLCECVVEGVATSPNQSIAEGIDLVPLAHCTVLPSLILIPSSLLPNDLGTGLARAMSASGPVGTREHANRANIIQGCGVYDTDPGSEIFGSFDFDEDLFGGIKLEAKRGKRGVSNTDIVYRC
ncbi:hypothetical protein RRG08_026779 [Elysia crispata]|uniref:Uncharacterized protein n=1 Tax=Elysia crispata TaxID=231223 RepID=A0AAE1ARA8_9GAST|nr:hypothetical protein RRG08_026779 [Elysia crispata]